MTLKTFFLENKRVIFCSFLICILSIFIYKKIIYNERSALITNKILLTQEELAKYDGIFYDKLYLSVMGSIFDVSNGARHYAKGNSYHYFVGKDGTRALVSGNFQDESNEKDHTLNLKCDDLQTIIHWRKTFREKYKHIGILEGRYYNSDGTETEYMRDVKNKMKKCREEKEVAKQKDNLYPPCNVAWNEAEGTRVWCSKSSGGISRNWVGAPRQLYAPGDSRPKCVCVQENIQSTNLFKEYEGCASTATECFIDVA